MSIDGTAAPPWQAAFPTPDEAPAALREKLSEQLLAANTYLFHQGDRANAVFAIAFGMVRLERHTANGHAIVIHRARVFAYLKLLADDDGTIDVDRPLKEMASEIGLTHEAFYLALAALANTGDIARDGRRLSVRPPRST